MVSDIAMPDDGLELIREVKTISETKGLHILTIAITACRDRPRSCSLKGSRNSWRSRSIRSGCAGSCVVTRSWTHRAAR